ncbi:class I SAM-dependent methyltransferase [Helicobacter sp. 23-1044]
MDKSYWSKFYAKHSGSEKPSLFAEFVWENYLALRGNNLKLIELGCGNGRDSVYFAKQGISVLGIDQCENMIATLNKRHKSANLSFQSGDFTALPNAEFAFDAIYSRFTLHSINATQQSNLFKWIAQNLSGILAIECRGYKNSLYGRGEMVEKDAFIYDNHYRRFVDFEALCEFLSDDYEVLFAKEDKGFAPFNGEDDYFFRIVGITRHERERERVKRATRFVVFIAFIKLDSSDKRVSYVA